MIPIKGETGTGILWGGLLHAHRLQFLALKLLQIMWKVDSFTSNILIKLFLICLPYRLLHNVSFFIKNALNVSPILQCIY